MQGGETCVTAGTRVLTLNLRPLKRENGNDITVVNTARPPSSSPTRPAGPSAKGGHAAKYRNT